MADPIGRAVNTFAALKGMDLQQQQFDENRKYRGFQMDMTRKADERAVAADERANKEHQNKLFDRDREEVIKTIQTSYTTAGDDPEKFDLEGLRSNLKTYHEKDPRLLPPAYRYLFDEDQLRKEATAVESLVGPIRNGALPDRKTAVEAFNTLYAPQLDARGQKYGAKQLRIADVVPTPDNKGVFFEAEVTKADGSTYRAPLTMNGGTAEDGDDEVKPHSVEDIFRSLAAKQKGYKLAQGYLMAEGKIKPKETTYSEFTDADGRVWAYDPKNPQKKQLLSDAVKTKSLDLDWRDNVLGEDGNPYQVGYDKKTGKEVTRVPQWTKDGSGSGGGKGKTDLIELKTGRFMTLSDAKNSYLATFGKPDGMGGFVIDQSSSPPNFAEWINDQAKSPVFTADRKADPKIWAMAEEMAGKWVKEQAGYFTADDSDFRAFGGNRAQAQAAKTQEFYAMLAGEPAPPPPSADDPDGQAPGQAPPSAIDALKANPSLIGQFEAKYGYRPEGFDASAKAGDSMTAKAKPPARGMASPGADSPGPAAVLGGMRANIPADNALTRANEAPAKMIQAGLNQLANYFVLDPARAAVSDIAKPFKNFQTWAQTRYKTPGAEKNPQALAEYAKVDPEGAKLIEQAAAQVASR